MRDKQKSNSSFTDAHLLAALRYEVSCIRSFYPNLAELRCSLQEVFILSVTAKPSLMESDRANNHALALYLVCELLKEIEKLAPLN